MKHPSGKRSPEPPSSREAHSFGFDHAVRNRLFLFSDLLARWNTTIKLVSEQDIAQLWPRHIEDSLQLIPHIPSDLKAAVDLGSGAGFPGLILAIATGVHFDLVESDARKAAFLQEAALLTGAPVTVHAKRLEVVALTPRRLVTARALAPLPKLLDFAKRLVADDGICLFFKGVRVDGEIAEAHESWTMDLEQIPSTISPSGRILRISDLRRREATVA